MKYYINLFSPNTALAFSESNQEISGFRISRKAYVENQHINIYNPQIEMFARFKMKSSFHKTKRII